jgi:hypothetical protein
MATNNVSIATAKLSEALKDWQGSPPVAVKEGATQQTVDLCKMPVEFLRALMATDLTKNQRQVIAAMVGDRSALTKEVVSNPNALSRILKTLHQPTEPTLEVLIAGRWYPVPISSAEYRNDQYHGAHTTISYAYHICDQNIACHATWGDYDFQKDGEKVSKTVEELLLENGLRIARPEAVEAWRAREGKASKIRTSIGRLMSVKAQVLAKNEFMWRQSLQPTNLGSKDRPRQVIVEDELEIGNQHHHGYGQRTDRHDLPFVRVFSTDLKQYVYADVDDLEEYSFDEKALDKLVLPGDMRQMIGRIFDTPHHKIFGDLFKGRHGGMIILANGTQGVGKTLTAEVFAEHTRRPLYVLEMGELGTNLSEVEKSLQRVFARAARWNAVLLFDEADVFLSKRQESDLERSAIVGVFLRLLDRYEGLFFLTTNRAEVIDPAFKSRITLKLDFPELDADARTQVWKKMLGQAGFRTDALDFGQVSAAEIDGRKIRNQVRLLRTLIEGDALATEQVLEVLRFAAK